MSKGLKALEDIKYMLDSPFTSSVIKQGLNTIEKELKVLEVIKEHFKIAKPVGVSIEKNAVGVGGLIQIKDLTIEDYSLLKEILL